MVFLLFGAPVVSERHLECKAHLKCASPFRGSESDCGTRSGVRAWFRQLAPLPAIDTSKPEGAAFFVASDPEPRNHVTFRIVGAGSGCRSAQIPSPFLNVMTNDVAMTLPPRVLHRPRQRGRQRCGLFTRSDRG